ncbi:hypothetical protein Vi05172_g4707 [Venturia inaequalis]|nr:hypothetical protein Vi05172_g4707 [Venturia inaequalis]
MRNDEQKTWRAKAKVVGIFLRSIWETVDRALDKYEAAHQDGKIEQGCCFSRQSEIAEIVRHDLEGPRTRFEEVKKEFRDNTDI